MQASGSGPLRGVEELTVELPQPTKCKLLKGFCSLGACQEGPDSPPSVAKSTRAPGQGVLETHLPLKPKLQGKRSSPYFVFKSGDVYPYINFLFSHHLNQAIFVWPSHSNTISLGTTSSSDTWQCEKLRLGDLFPSGGTEPCTGQVTSFHPVFEMLPDQKLMGQISQPTHTHTHC